MSPFDHHSENSARGHADVGATYIVYARRRLIKEYLPKIRRCVERLSEEDVWWRAHETDNSVGNLLLHLSGNVRQWIIAGVGGGVDNRNRAREFSERSHLSRKDLLDLFETTLHEADQTLLKLDASRILETRHIQKWDVTCLDAISHVVEHVAQHMGQIIYITKLRTGEDLKFYDL